MDEFRFAELSWVHAMWIVMLVAIVLIGLEMRGRSILDRLVSTLMQNRLVSRISLSRRLCSIAIFCLGLVAVVFGLMRPQWGMNVQKMARVDSQIMICLDLSKSMLAEDVVPSRLERSKAEIDSLLALLDEGQQVGLIGFAGKATVLCPMTTDFGFLRLILREASPSIVGMGGTRIGEALQKAADGFRETGDVNRLILLITDGEDHDSFPLDAAEKAKEKGARVVCVGFGDEIGSKIEVTDPQTGVRRFVKDSEGNAVLSALDGETLRDIALKTEGAYVPAGTRALDLQSIYDTHIKTLLKGSDTKEDRVIRNEGFQWCILVALPLIVVSFLMRIQVNSPVASRRFTQAAAPLVAFLCLVITPVRPSEAATLLVQTSAAIEEPGERNTKADKTDESAAFDDKTEESDTAEADEDPPQLRELDQPPRTLYNMGIRLISANPDRAEKLLTEARNKAGVDGELRYRSLFNLSWVELERSEKKLESESEKALQHLEYAAGYLRDAIRIRPDADEARKNLELVMQKILALRDKLAKKNEETYESRLDDLIQAQREHQAELQQLTIIADSLDNVSKMRDAFRKVGVTQRRVISNMQVLHTDALRELESLRQETAQAANSRGPSSTASKPVAPGENQIDPRLRMAQLEQVSFYLDQALQSIARSRSFTRRSQADRAFLRWSAALTQTKRARDQLRNPVELLQRLAGEGVQIGQGIKQVQFSASKGEPAQSTTPAWLTDDYLQDEQSQMIQRCDELRMIFEGTVENSESQAGSETGDNGQQKTMLENIKLAIPELNKATSLHKDVLQELRSKRYSKALEDNGEAGLAMLRAAEFFSNLQQMIETSYSVESQIAAMEKAARSQIAEENWDATLELFAGLQEQNQIRRKRLVVLLQQEKERVESQNSESQPQNPAAPPTSGAQDAEAQKQQLKRIEIALQIVDALEADMAAVTTGIKGMQAADRSSNERPPSPETTFQSAESVLWRKQFPRQPVDAAVQKLGELRRLFFTLIEHLKDTVERQAELSDETNEALPRKSPSHQELGAMQNRQSELQDISRQIAQELVKQGEQTKASTQSPAGSATGDPQDAVPDPQQLLDQAENMVEAARLVEEGANLMKTAKEQIQDFIKIETEPAQNPAIKQSDPPEQFDDSKGIAKSAKEISDSQTQALQKLVEALELLDQQQDQDDQQQGQQQNENDQQQDQQEQQQNQSQPQQQQQMNAEQMLQAIRDREAQRREDKNSRAVLSSGAVEKDW